MSSVLFLIQVSRPLLWFVLPLVYYLGLHAAHAELNAAAIAQLVLLSFPMSLIGCGLNDIYDYESDRLSQRRQAVWGAVVSDDHRVFVFQACLAMMPLMVFGALITRNADNFVATVCLLLLSWMYSVPPIRLKERPPLDALANGAGYFLLPFVMGYCLGANPRSMPLKYYLLAFCVCGIHALASAVDYDVDRAAGHRTFAVIFGRRAAAAFAFTIFLVTLLFAGIHSPAVLAYLAGCALITLVATIATNERTITAACGTIFVGFPLAALLHVAGW